MEKTTLKLYEFLSLEAELLGTTNQQTGEVISKGLLSENIRLVIKYWLTELTKKASAEKTVINEMRDDLLKKHLKEGETSIQTIIVNKDGTQEVNPAYLEFDKELAELLQEEKQLEHFSFSLDHFNNVESSNNYSTFFKLIKVTE